MGNRLRALRGEKRDGNKQSWQPRHIGRRWIFLKCHGFFERLHLNPGRGSTSKMMPWMCILGKVCLFLLPKELPNCISCRHHKSQFYSYVHKIERREKLQYEDFCVPFLPSVSFYLAHWHSAILNSAVFKAGEFAGLGVEERVGDWFQLASSIPWCAWPQINQRGKQCLIVIVMLP